MINVEIHLYQSIKSNKIKFYNIQKNKNIVTFEIISILHPHANVSFSFYTIQFIILYFILKLIIQQNIARRRSNSNYTIYLLATSVFFNNRIN